MRTFSKIIAALAILALALVPVGLMADSSSADIGFADNPVVVGEFGDMGDGKVKVTLFNTSASPVNVTIKAVDVDNTSRVWCTKTVQVPAKENETNGTVSTDLVWHIDSSGTYTIRISATPDDGTGEVSNLLCDVSVSHSIWKDPITYVVIVVVIIAIAIAVFIKLRSNEGKKKEKNVEQKSFTQMHEEKKLAASNASAKKEKAPETFSAEKKTYKGNSERKARQKK